MERYVLSQMSDKNFSKAVAAIYMQTAYNHEQYPEYLKWFYTVNLPRIFKGKGDIKYWVCLVKPGKILFEISSTNENLALKALNYGASKLSIQTKIVKLSKNI